MDKSSKFLSLLPRLLEQEGNCLSPKMMWAIALVAFINHLTVGSGQSDNCFVPGECLSSIHIGGREVNDKRECLELCKSTEGE
jgi:hypothetical protein